MRSVIERATPALSATAGRSRPMAAPTITDLRLTACTIPTDASESDGTLAWDSTTIVIVEADGGGRTGLGYTYGARACGAFIDEILRDVVVGQSALEAPGTWLAMQSAVRNNGRVGLAAMAISAVDIALWDLAARLLELPVCTLIGPLREEVPIYGSGGF